MRQDQIDRLHTLQEKLADVVLDEGDPDHWPGAGKTAAEMTREERGDRFWSKRNAAATFALLERTTSTLDYHPARGQKPAEAEVDIERQIAKREREAESLLQGAITKARKLTDDERAAGKR